MPFCDYEDSILSFVCFSFGFLNLPIHCQNQDKQISFLEISQFLSELSATFQEALNEEFERFGIELVNFYCESIAPKPEEYEKLRGYKE